MMLSAWILASLMACGGTSETPSPVGGDEAAAPAARGARSDIDVEGLASKLGEGVTVIDVRTDGEYASGHVPGAVHVPLDRLTADHPVMKVLPKDEPVYFVCASGGRSSRAADAMAKAGFQTVNVKGGTQAWIAGGHAVE